jgi:hypothetical protein
MLGWLAAVTETESPSQLRPAVIQTMWTSSAPALVAIYPSSNVSQTLALNRHQRAVTPLKKTHYDTPFASILRQSLPCSLLVALVESVSSLDIDP